MAAPLTREEYQRSHTRLVWMVIVQYAFGVLVGGFFYASAQANAHERCVDNLQRTRTAARLLPKIVAAAKADHDPNMVAFWNDYLTQLRKAPPAKC